jgi:protoporphyrinogen oxidase
MTPIVNTDVAMPKKLFESLCLFETWCVAKQKTNTSEQEVKQWLTERFGDKVASQFKAEFLYS